MAGTTSNNSWPYPESSDFVADGATAIENLADAIDADFDTGVLKVDSTNSRVGINDAAPSYALDVTGDISTTGVLRYGSYAIGTWVSYTPTITNVAIGNGVLDFRYAVIGDTVFVEGYFELGSTSAISGKAEYSLPYTADSSSINIAHGTARISDVTVRNYVGVVRVSSSTRGEIEGVGTTVSPANGVSFGTNSPFTWATGDKFGFSLIYSRA